MAGEEGRLPQLEAKRHEQTPQALARLVVVVLFVGVWLLLWLLRIPMPVPFLLTLLLEAAFFLLYWRTVFLLPTVRSIERANYVMLAAEITFHTTMVYFLGGVSWLGAFAYVFGLVFTNTFLDMRRGFVYTLGAASAFVSMALLDANGVIPHQTYLDQGSLRFAESQYLTTTILGAVGVFFSLYLWVNWVGRQLRSERDGAVRAQEELLRAQTQLRQANAELEARVQARTAEQALLNRLLSDSEQRLRTVVSNAPVVLFSLDPEGVFTLCEGRGLEDLGVDPGSIVGRSLFEVFEDEPEVQAGVRRALEGESATIVARPGESVFEAQLAPVRDKDGRLAGLIGVATNITERTHAEQEQEKLASLVENSSDFIGIASLDGRVFYLNAAGQKLVGLESNEAAAATTIFDYFADEDIDGIRDHVVPAVLARGHWEGELRFRHFRTGEMIPAQVNGFPIRDRVTGHPIALATVSRDITERKRAEEALRESEERLRTVVSNAPLVLWALDADGVFTLSEGKGLELLGLKPGDLVGRSIHDVYRDLPELIENNRRALAGETFTNTVEVGGLTFESHYAPLFGPDGRVNGVIGVASDTTERRRAEAALQESESKFRTMAETVAAAAFIFKGTKMRYVNSAAVTMTGYDRDELLAMDFWDIMHPEFQELAKERGLARQRDEQAPNRYEVKIRTKGGDDLWVDFTAGSIEYEGEPAVLGTAFDITERKRAEEALREQARRDPLTGMLNRRAGLATLETFLSEAKQRGGRLSVLVLDIDTFKRINDSFGHEAGDEALLRLSDLLTNSLGQSGAVCRLGGDEFEVGLNNAGPEEALAFAERIRWSLHRALANRAGPRFTLGIGIACYPGDGDTLAELTRRADAAMYAAKAAGGDASRTWRQLSRQAA